MKPFPAPNGSSVWCLLKHSYPYLGGSLVSLAQITVAKSEKRSFRNCQRDHDKVSLRETDIKARRSWQISGLLSSYLTNSMLHTTHASIRFIYLASIKINCIIELCRSTRLEIKNKDMKRYGLAMPTNKYGF